MLSNRKTTIAFVTAVTFFAQSVRPTNGEEQSILKGFSSWIPRQEIKLSDAPDRLQQLATAIVRDQIPKTYDDTRKWGMTKEIVSGLHLRTDGLKIRTKRKRKQVNHGTWTRYRITQLDPNENLTVKIDEIQEQPDGRVAFRIDLTAKMAAYARLSEWNRGVRVASVSVDANMDVLLTVWCVLGIQLDITKFPPDVILKPEITESDITLRQFKVKRISKLNGPVAKQLGKSLQKIAEKKIDEKRPKLVAKINKKIESNQDKLRLSVSDFVSEKWDKFVGPETDDSSASDSTSDSSSDGSSIDDSSIDAPSDYATDSISTDDKNEMDDEEPGHDFNPPIVPFPESQTPPCT